MSESFTIKEIRALLEMLQKHEVTEFKLERKEEKIWLKRGTEAPQAVPQYPILGAQLQGQMPYPLISAGAPIQNLQSYGQPDERPQQAQQKAPAPELAPVAPVEAPIVRPAGNIKEIKSPMVGTFYRRPAVDAKPYVEVGDSVKKGDVLCIVEAMKLMNEIESDVSGKIVEVCLEDGQMVEFGEVLFRIEAY